MRYVTSSFPPKSCIHFCFLHACYMPRQSQPPKYYHPKWYLMRNRKWQIKIIIIIVFYSFFFNLQNNIEISFLLISTNFLIPFCNFCSYHTTISLWKCIYVTGSPASSPKLANKPPFWITGGLSLMSVSSIVILVELLKLSVVG